MLARANFFSTKHKILKNIVIMVELEVEFDVVSLKMSKKTLNFLKMDNEKIILDK
jgi:hypothetical protein